MPSPGGSYCDDWEINDHGLDEYDDDDYDYDLDSSIEGDPMDESDHDESLAKLLEMEAEAKAEFSRKIQNDDDDEADESGDDESDADGEMGVRALAYDPNQLSNSNGLPVNGHDYLKLVQEERNQLPAVVTVMPPPQASAKKSTQSSTIPMEVLHCDEEIGTCHENYKPSQQSSFHPMDTSVLRESHLSSSSSSLSSGVNEHHLENNHNSSIYSGMASKEFREQLRLKSIGCTPLNLDRVSKPSTSAQSTSKMDRDLIHRDQILTNFLSLRSHIDGERKHKQMNQGQINLDENCDITDKDDEPKQRKGGKKNQSRCDRRAASLVRNINLGHPPLLNILVHRSQREIHLTLEHLADQSEKAPIYSTLHADWIYSLIALLREPIEPDICSTLRRLAKLCMNRRDMYERRSSATNGLSLDQPETSSKELVDAINDEEYYACLLIICIVRYHFGQADLK